MKRRLLVPRSLGEGGILFILLLVVLLGGLAWFLFHQPPEPAYQGKPLHEWLARYTPPGSLRGSDPDADRALRQIGTNAVPILLRMLQEKDSPLKLKWIALLEKQHIIRPPQQAILQNLQADRAFRALGSAASNAVPALVRIYRENHSPDSQAYILMALGSIGPTAAPEATPVLLDALTNSQSGLRMDAVTAIGQIHSQPDLFVPPLINALKDADPGVRQAAVWSLGVYGPQAKSAAPALVPLLNDPNPFVPTWATNALKAIDPVAASAGINDPSGLALSVPTHPDVRCRGLWLSSSFPFVCFCKNLPAVFSVLRSLCFLLFVPVSVICAISGRHSVPIRVLLCPSVAFSSFPLFASVKIVCVICAIRGCHSILVPPPRLRVLASLR